MNKRKIKIVTITGIIAILILFLLIFIGSPSIKVRKFNSQERKTEGLVYYLPKKCIKLKINSVLIKNIEDGRECYVITDIKPLQEIYPDLTQPLVLTNQNFFGNLFHKFDIEIDISDRGILQSVSAKSEDQTLRIAASLMGSLTSIESLLPISLSPIATSRGGNVDTITKYRSEILIEPKIDQETFVDMSEFLPIEKELLM